MSFYTYILYSKSKDRYYIGSTSDLQSRLIKHNQRHKGFTGSACDWQIIYTEQYSDKQAALERERKMKSWKSRIMIEKLIGSEHPD